MKTLLSAILLPLLLTGCYVAPATPAYYDGGYVAPAPFVVDPFFGRPGFHHGFFHREFHGFHGRP